MGRNESPSLPGMICLVLGCCMMASALSGAPQDDTGRLLVFLDVPAEAPPPTVLTVSGLEVRGPSGLLGRGNPRYAELDARSLAGTQVLLAEMELPAGICSELLLRLDKVRTAVGSAPVVPSTDPDGYPVAIDLDLAPGACAAVFLRWFPARESGREQPYVPALEERVETLPPLGSLALVTRRDIGVLLAVDRVAGRVVHIQRLGEDPRDLVYSSLQQKVFVALAGEDALTVVDALSLRPERTVTLQFGDEPVRLALAADGMALHVLNFGSRSLVTLDARSLQERARVAVGEGPRALHVDSGSGQVYVACEDEGQVQVVDTKQGRVVATHTDVSSPCAVVFDASQRGLYVASASQYRLFAFDLQEGTDLGSQSLCAPAFDLVFQPRSRQVYASVPGCRMVAVLQPAAGLEFSPLKLPYTPGRLTFDPQYSQFLVTAPQAGFLIIGDPHRGRIVARVEVGGNPTAVVAP